MKFFVPGIEDPSEAERDYGIVREFLRSQGFEVLSRRILAVAYRHKESSYMARVGKPSTQNNEMVAAIYELSSGSYAICTLSRGWDMEHLPILTGSSGDDEVVHVEYFKP